MSITDSLYDPSSFACALPLCVNLNVNLKVADTRSVPTILHTYEFIRKCEKYTRKIEN